MKHYYFQSGIFRSIRMLGIVLSSVTFISACSGDIEDLPSGPNATGSGQEVVKDDSILRFPSMEDLENISLSDIPGEYDGYELAELTYECNDTIELRALRFDVTATLTSASRPAKTIRFEAEVGPELVSVEYYPSAEVLPAYGRFLMDVFYPKVERYRNYSDGSRIGPDEFYDYGHFLYIAFQPDSYRTDANRWFPYFISENWSLIPTEMGSFAHPDYLYYKDGVFYTHQKGLIEYNLNTTVIEDNGVRYTGEDFYHKNVKSREDWSTLREPTAQARDFYNMYRPSRLYPVSDEEYAYYVNLCRDVPDVSPSPYPADTKSLAPGWYYGEFLDQYFNQFWLYSDYELSLSEYPYFQHGRAFYLDSRIMLQYLVIDNRIIDFVDLALKDYKSLAENYPTFSISKTSSGYMVHSEFEQIMYGEKF
ncbi:MAG: hypothetical protein K2K93_05200, partial [Muribaculaceae bacterium]|nr:hypothetical protein [Muribaculaceae bacterium]